MPLATLLLVCALLGPPFAVGRSRIVFQDSGQPQQDTAPANQTQNPPESDKKTEPGTTPITAPEPAQENPPVPAGAPEVQPTPTPEAQPATPPAQAPSSETKPEENPKPAAPAKPTATHRRSTKTASHTAAKTPGTTPTKPAGKATKRRHKPAPKTAAKPTAPQAPKKVVVQNGGTVDPKVQLSPSLTQQQSSSQRQNVAQLLSATDANLKKLSGRQLNSSQSDTLNQINQYTQQAKAAADAGDMERARNLAVKARVLSEELVKQ